MLLGLVRPTAGSGRVLGMDIVTQSVEIRQVSGYQPESQSLFSHCTARQIVDFNSKLFPTWDRGLVERHLGSCKLPLDKRIAEYSRGMKSQPSLVLALGSRPQVLFLDEPTSGLDPVAVRHFLGVVLQEAVDNGQTVFMSSHLLHQVERVADWVGIMDRGKLVVCRPCEELKLNVKKIRVAFQVDPPAALFAMRGISKVKGEGRRWLISVTEDFDDVLQAVSTVPHFALEVMDQILEDIFLRYAGDGGPRSE